MARLGLSFQRPDRRAREADPEAMREWTETTYPAIRATAEEEDAMVLFADQVGRTTSRAGPGARRAGLRSSPAPGTGSASTR
jgi:hypothetical protein